MVPPEWQHPTEWGKDWRTGRLALRFKPLFDGGYAAAVSEWDTAAAQFDAGFVKSYAEPPAPQWEARRPDQDGAYADYAGPRPEQSDYMPEFPAGTATHFMMYETTSEGTPISPAFATPEELARWLADNNVSANADDTATYEQWLRVCQGGFAPDMVLSNAGLQSGVVAMSDLPNA